MGALVRLVWTVVLTAAVVVAVTVGRLLVVSGYRIPAATSVADSLGAVATVVGAVLPVLGAVLPVAATVLVVAAVVALVVGSRHRAHLLVAATVTVAATLVLSPSAVTLDGAVDAVRDPGNELVAALSWADWFPAGLAAAILLVAGLVRRDTEPRFRLGRFLVLGVVSAVLLAGFALVAQDAYRPLERVTELPAALERMWLPAERIAAVGGPARIGYVLSSDDGWTTVLWDDDRAVAVLAPGAIRARSVCRAGPPEDPPLLSAAPRGVAEPACPVPAGGTR